MTYRYARDRAMTLLVGGAYIERRTKASPKSRADTQDVYYLVWYEPVDDAGLCEVRERRMWRGTFFTLLEENRLVPKLPFPTMTSNLSEPTKWVLNK